MPVPAPEVLTRAAPPAAPRLRDLRALPRSARLLLAGIAINRAGTFVPVFLALYLISLGASATAAGVALTCYGAGGIAGVVAGGTITDRIGARLTIAWSMLATGALVGALPFIGSFAALLVLCAGAGFAGDVFRPAASDLLAAFTPRDRMVLVSSVHRVMLNVGATIGPLVGALLVSHSYTSLFLADAATSLAFAGAMWRWLPTTRGERRGVARGGYRVVFADRRFTLFLLAMLTIAIVEIQYIAALPLAMHASGLSTALYTALVALNGLLVILVELPLTRYTQTWPMRRAITLGVGLIALGMALYGVGYAVIALVAATLVWTLGEIVAGPSANAYPALIAPERSRSRFIAAATASQGLGCAIGPALGAAVFAFAGDGVWVACAIAGVAAVALSAAGVQEPDRSSRVALADAVV